MDERDQRAARAGSRLFIYQPHIAGFQFGEFRVDVVDLDAQVMNSGAAFGDELSDRSLVSGRFQQFDAAFADGQHRDSHALIFNNFDIGQFQSERVAPETERLVNRTDRDTEMLNFGFRWIRQKITPMKCEFG